MQHRTVNKASGFTLIELMISVLVASILIGVAIPSYMNSVPKSRRTDAKTAIVDMAGREEKYFNTNNAYTNLAANIGYALAGSTATVTSLAVGSGYYLVTISNITAGTTTTPPTYTITAVPTGTQTADSACASFTMTSAGAQTSLNTGGTDTSSTCWH